MAVDSRKITILHEEGLHARPAAMFVQIANKYDSKVTVIKEETEVNGKSIMGILMLEAHKGSVIEIIAEGEDASQALDDLEEFLKNEGK